MTNDEISVVLDYLDEKVKQLTKQNKRIVNELSQLEERVDDLETKLKRTNDIASASWFKGVF